MTEIRVALAAETILYAPVYLISQKRLLGPHSLHILPSEGKTGDRAAYERLRKDADICIADPIVCRATDGGPLNGRVVGCLLNKVGLWAVSSCHAAAKLKRDDATFYSTKSDEEMALKSVVTYSDASTAGRVMNYVRARRKLELEIYAVPFGTELQYVFEPLPKGGPDVVVTCDLAGALAIEHHSHDLRRLTAKRRGGAAEESLQLPRVVSHLHKDPENFGRFFFTSVVASNEMLKKAQGALLQDFLRALQDSIDYFYGASDQKLEDLAEDLNRMETMFPSLGESQTCAIFRSRAERQDDISRALRYMKDNLLLSPSVRLDQRTWDVSYRVWALDGRSGEDFRRHADPRPAREAAPGALVARAREFWELIRAPLGSVGLAWGILATIVGLLGYSGREIFFLVLGFSLILGVVIWLLGRLLLGE